MPIWERKAVIRLIVCSLAVSAAGVAPAFCQPRPHPALKRGQERAAAVLGMTLLPMNGRFGVDANHSDEPLLWVIQPDGTREQFGFSFDGGKSIAIYAASLGSDGSLAVEGTAYSNDGRGASFIARVSPDRGLKTVTRLTDYAPRSVALASDGVLWAIGWQKDTDQFNVLKRFDSNGNVISSTVLKVRAPLSGIRDAAQAGGLRASDDRVGWLTDGDEYIEFSLDGSELGRYEGPSGLQPARDSLTTTFALSARNQAIIAMVADNDRRNAKLKLVSLDRSSRSWVPVDVDGEGPLPFGRIVAFDSEDLVVLTPKTGSALFATHFAVANPLQASR